MQNPASPKSDIYHFVGTILKGRYELNEFVDEGGMGIVYRAHDLSTQTIVAVKILPPRFLINEQRGNVYLKLFQREAEVLERLRHPNIVSVLDAGIENNMVFMVMEWLEGCTLGTELLNTGRFSLERTAIILNQVCNALDKAHRKKIIHLDIKPNNIFIINKGTPQERVKVIDFGLSRIIQSTLGSTISRVVGTPQYMAPEVFLNKASHLSDVYSVGILTYEMLTGLLPFSTTQIYALIHQQMSEKPPSIRKANKKVPEYVEDLIHRTLEKSPAYRPQSVLEFLREFKMGIQIPDKKPTKIYQSFKPVVYLDEPYIKNKGINWTKGLMFWSSCIGAVVCAVLLFLSGDSRETNSKFVLAASYFLLISFMAFLLKRDRINTLFLIVCLSLFLIPVLAIGLIVLVLFGLLIPFFYLYEMFFERKKANVDSNNESKK